jgi:hypothetical protein
MSAVPHLAPQRTDDGLVTFFFSLPANGEAVHCVLCLVTSWDLRRILWFDHPPRSPSHCLRREEEPWSFPSRIVKPLLYTGFHSMWEASPLLDRSPCCRPVATCKICDDVQQTTLPDHWLVELLGYLCTVFCFAGSVVAPPSQWTDRQLCACLSNGLLCENVWEFVDGSRRSGVGDMYGARVEIRSGSLLLNVARGEDLTKRW